MEVTLNNVQVLAATDEFASLEESEDKSVYRYFFKLACNKTLVSDTGAAQLVVRTYRNHPKDTVSLSVFEPTSRARNILNQNVGSLIRNIQRKASGTTTRINEARARTLTVNSYSLPDLVKAFNHGVGYTVVTHNPKKAVRNKVPSSAATATQTPLNEDQTFSQLSLDMLVHYKTDPASVLTPTYVTRTAYETNNGVSYDEQASSSGLVNSLLAGNSTAARPSRTVIQTYSIAERETLDITAEAWLSKEAIQEMDFYVMFSVYGVDGDLVQEFIKLVHHRTSLSLNKEVTIPPGLNAAKLSGGQLAITLNQTDPNAQGVKLYKTAFNTTSAGTEAKQEYVGSLSLPTGETRTLLLQNNSPGLLLFRALSFSADANTSCDFSSQVLEVEASELGTPKEATFVSLDYEYVASGLSITVSKMPDDVAFLKLYKTNLTVDATLETLLITFYVGGQGKNSSYAYLDSDLDKLKTYRYRCKLVNTKGNEYDASAAVELYYRPVTENYAVPSFTAPLVTAVQQPGDSTQYYNVEFSVTYAITNKLEDDVRAMLTRQGLIQYYGSDINRENLKRLLITKVELRDLETNDKVSLGFMDDTFVQQATSYGLLSRGSRYVYELTTYVRSPTTLLAQIVLTGNSTPRANSLLPPTYQYSPFNLEHPFGLQVGTNPQSSGNEFTAQYGIDQLGFGAVTGINYARVDLKPPAPTINNVRVYALNSKRIRVSWAVNGNQENISHFVVRRQNMQTGIIDLLGKAHGVNTQNSFFFSDNLRYTETGVFRYILNIQFFNMRLGPDFFSSEVMV